ncbi:MAG: hypothetical protein KDJ73_04925 [Notoacmeibacter sp.]|nr:hypothetical protein [Notoacmeibacter sp.]MCC0032821.1 hypothetical protein [Brucellaceae bacterium]
MKTTRLRSQILSRRMSRATLFLMVLVAILLAAVGLAAIIAPGEIGKIMAERFGGRVIETGRTASVLIALVTAIQGALFLWALDKLRRAFASFSGEAVLNSRSAVLLSHAGLLFAANAVAMIIAQPLLSAIYSAGAPAGQGFITIRIGTGELLSLLLSGILFVTGHLMALAAEVDGEMRQIV